MIRVYPRGEHWVASPRGQHSVAVPLPEMDHVRGGGSRLSSDVGNDELGFGPGCNVCLTL